MNAAISASDQGHSLTFKLFEGKLSKLDKAIEDAEKEVKQSDLKIQALNKKLRDENSSLDEKKQCLIDSKKAHVHKVKNEFTVLQCKFEKENIVSEFAQTIDLNTPIEPMDCVKLISEHDENRRTILVLKESLVRITDHEEVLNHCKKLKELVKRQKELEVEMQVYSQYLPSSASSEHSSITTECVDAIEVEDLKSQSLPLDIVKQHFDRNSELRISVKKPSQPCLFRVVTDKTARITGQFFIGAIPCDVVPSVENSNPVELRVNIKYFQGLHPIQIVFLYKNTGYKINTLNL